MNWLNDPHYNLAALIIYGIWSMLPFTIILLLSGFQNINPQYYTAARIDGASSGRISAHHLLCRCSPRRWA